MTAIAINDLAKDRTLDRGALRAVRGGNSWLAGLGPVANVNIAIDQDITQFQNISVGVLNNVGFIGAGFGGVKLDLAPQQLGLANVAF